MRATIGAVGALVMAVGGLLGSARTAAAAEMESSITVLPVRYIDVQGDDEKFRAHHWIKDGYGGGIEDFSLKVEGEGDTEFRATGHAIIDDNDLGTALEYNWGGLGYVHLNFQEFRKYYDGTGGVYPPFTTLSGSETDKRLEMDIGKIELEAGLTLEDFPDIKLFYEREYKDGTKSRLTWSEAEEAVTRNIAPTWQEVDEIVDVVGFEIADEVAEWNLTTKHEAEFVDIESVRLERDISTTATAADKLMRRHDQRPEAAVLTSLFGAERAFLEEKVFFASAYHFAHLTAREYEDLYELNAAGVPTNFFSFSEQKRNARADSDVDTHAWVGNLAVDVADSLTLTTRLKAELAKRESVSVYPEDGSPASGASPDGVIDGIENNISDSNEHRWGEAVSLKFTGIPRTSVYTDLELEQARIRLREDQSDGITGANSFYRDTVTDVRRGGWTLGARSSPWRFLDVTSQVRHKRSNNDYDDQFETSFSSAFIDYANKATDEFTTRVTLKPRRWLRTSFRYQLRDDDYATAVQGMNSVETQTLSHIYTYDVALQPLNGLLVLGSVSRQDADVVTPARHGPNPPIAAFSSDVTTWLLTVDYTPTSAVSLTSSLLYADAENFNDVSPTALPYGIDNERLDLELGVNWSPKEDVTLGAKYGYYHYLAKSLAEAGNYRANALWLEVSKKF
ncbi:MAG TPA: hypothetical protein VGB20_04905 [bacterium]